VINWICISQEVKTINIFDQKGILKENLSIIQDNIKINDNQTKLKTKTNAGGIDVTIEKKESDVMK
jgi:hypothetical protein